MTTADAEQAAHLRRVVLGAMKSFEDAHYLLANKESLAKRIMGALLAELGLPDDQAEHPLSSDAFAEIPGHTYRQFREVCELELRNDLDAVSIEWLQEPEQRDRWQEWLVGTLMDIESQLGQRAVEHQRAKLLSLSQGNRYPEWLQIDADHADWRRRAVHTKQGIEHRMRTIRQLRGASLREEAAERAKANGSRMSNSEVAQAVQMMLVQMEARIRGVDEADVPLSNSV